MIKLHFINSNNGAGVGIIFIFLYDFLKKLDIE